MRVDLHFDILRVKVICRLAQLVHQLSVTRIKITFRLWHTTCGFSQSLQLIANLCVIINHLLCKDFNILTMCSLQRSLARHDFKLVTY